MGVKEVVHGSSRVPPIADLNPNRCVVLATGCAQAGSPTAAGFRELERRGYSVWWVEGAGHLDRLRSQAVTEVLARGFSETLWIDSQIEFDPNDVVKLRAHQLSLVAGVCPREGGRGFAMELLPGTSRVELGTEGGLLEIQYAAAGFLLVRREVYETFVSRLRLPLCSAAAGPPFISYFLPHVTEGDRGAIYLESDFAFCQRARQCGFSIFADTTIRLWRNGNYRYSWEDAGGGLPRSPACELRVVSAQGASAAAKTALSTPRTREPFQSPQVEAFRQAHPWPEQKPAVATREKEGWLFPSTQEMLARFLSNETKLVVELGSWLGLSTRFIASRAPRAAVIAVDHWQGSPEHQHDPALRELLPKLYETFLVNCWNERARIIPARLGTIEGLEEVARRGLLPDLVYVDADHGYEGVAADLQAIQRLFPRAIIVGDDWNWDGVRRAATDFSTATGRRLEALEAGWCILVKKRVKMSVTFLTFAARLLACAKPPIKGASSAIRLNSSGPPVLAASGSPWSGDPCFYLAKESPTNASSPAPGALAAPTKEATSLPQKKLLSSAHSRIRETGGPLAVGRDHHRVRDSNPW